MNCIKMSINEFVNLRELFKNNPKELKKLETLAKSVLFTNSIRMKRACIKLIKEEYKSIGKIFTGDNQIMAEIHLYNGSNGIIRNGYICDVPKEHIGKHRKVKI